MSEKRATTVAVQLETIPPKDIRATTVGVELETLSTVHDARCTSLYVLVEYYPTFAAARTTGPAVQIP